VDTEFLAISLSLKKIKSTAIKAAIPEEVPRRHAL
jgi:hypothetical protein